MTTMIVDRPRKTSLGVGFDAAKSRSGNAAAPAWKQNIGTRPVPARLALLPEGKSRWSRVWLSAILQVSVVVGAIVVPLLYPESMKTNVKFLSSVLTSQPVTEIPVAPPPPPPPAPKAPKIPPKVEVKPPDPEPVKLNPQQPHIFTNLVAPKAVQPKVEKETKLPDMKPVLEAEKMDTAEKGPKRPKEDVKLNNMNSGSAAPATVKAPPDKVQTGGFGDPNGVPGKGDPNHATNVNRQGNPALPGGEGFGNGTGGKNGIAGTVASTGFGNGTAIPPTTGKPKSTVVAGGFGAVDTSSDPSKKKTAASGPADTTPNILDKPRPEYTAEGRSMRIEGDVVIDLVFLANGSIQINRVVSGLGHGLDESALRAAQQIKFKPAKREGEPVDFPARVRIEFRLAY